MINEVYSYGTSLIALIELPLRRSFQGSVLYSPFTIDHSQL